MNKQERMNNYLNSIYYGEGYVTIDKLATMDIKYDQDLRGGDISAEEIVAYALNQGFKLKQVYGEWSLEYRR